MKGPAGTVSDSIAKASGEGSKPGMLQPGTNEASTPRGKSCPVCCGRRQDFPRIRRTSNLLILVQLVRGKFA